jgi:uncharacterized integral membrane protein (TIGR02327 family)
MNYELYLYVFNIMLSLYVLSGVNINAIIKTNKELEAKLLVLILAFIMGYLLTNFVVDFLEISKIIG